MNATVNPACVLPPACFDLALDIDRTLGAPKARGRLERRVVVGMIQHLAKRGFVVVAVFDGDELGDVTAAPEGPDRVKAACELIFNLDEASVRFVRRVDEAAWKADRKNDGRCWSDVASEHGVLIVLGNDGWDAISDWNYAVGDPDGFDAAMNEVSDACGALPEAQ